MSYRVDPAFADSGRHAQLARQRRRRRRRLLVGGGIALCALLGVGLAGVLLLRGPGQGAPTATALADAETLTPVEIDEPADAPRPNAARAFLDLRGDPLLIRLPEVEDATGRARRLPVPEALDPARAGPAGSLGLALVADRLLQTEQRLMTTIPSSRADLALFEAHRSRGIEALSQGAGRPAAAAGAQGSWGDALPVGATAAERVRFVQTRTAETTSWIDILPEARRRPLYEERVFVLRLERGLAGLLVEELGYARADADRLAAASARILQLPDTLPANSLVALRQRPTPDGPYLLQMSIYEGDLHRGSLAQIGAGRFAPADDPFIDADLERHRVRMQAREPFETRVRLLDALYSAGLRNGLPTGLVGDMIVMMAQVFDLDRFAGAGDEVLILYVPDPPPDAERGAELLYVGIRGPVGTMDCFVLPDANGDYACHGAAMAGGMGVFAGGASAAVETLVDRIITVESAGNPDARNPLSTATGLGQFIEGTWLRMMEIYRPDLVATLSREALLALRTEPEISREMTRNYARENEAYLRAAGHAITPGRLYLAHFLGRVGADRALTALPTASVVEVMGERVVAANPFLTDKTIADLLAWSDRKMAGAGVSEAAQPAQSRQEPVPPAVLEYQNTVLALLATP